jgi:hypothetical protein
MGLGAFTKVVGDAGVTVAKRAPLPITTGNSYSASGALWAAHDAMLRMRLLPKPPKGKGRVKFKAMVVGATGAIGSVSARACWCGRPKRSTWSRPRPPSCWRSRNRSCRIARRQVCTCGQADTRHLPTWT